MTRRGPFFNRALPRLVFIDETSTNTKLTKRTGWAPQGERYRTYAPFGAWKTQTFIAGLRCHGLTAPWIVNAPMNKHIFEIYVETQLAPTLSKGDVVIMEQDLLNGKTIQPGDGLLIGRLRGGCGTRRRFRSAGDRCPA